MSKPRSYCLRSMLLIVMGLFGLLFLLAGCANDIAPVVNTPATALTKALSTPSVVSTTMVTSAAGMTESVPHVSPYIKVTVVAVEVRPLDTNPVQVELVIRGTLPDQCKYQFYSVENRAEQTVKVNLDGIHPADTSCLQTDQTIEYVLPLGRDMPEAERGFSPGDYKLVVNNYQASFSIKP